MAELMQIAKYSLCIVWTSPSARIHVSRAHKHVRILRTKDGARVFITYFLAIKVIFVLSLVASLGKYISLEY